MENNKKIIMEAHYKVNLLSEGTFIDLYRDDRITDISLGGFAFIIDGKYIPFDFDASMTWVKKDTLVYKSGKGAFFNDFFISEDHFDLIEKEGIKFDDVSAEFLSRVSEISEFFVDLECDGEEWGAGNNEDPDNLLQIEILDITFYDENDKAWPVSKEVINKFNKVA